ncbi:MAG: energy-coupling factor transporter ATPase [Candidatus Latescibacteria bacterium]|nr:energy-coupling factor transporter ATPase [Candidatus Latescibacterota bacterium]
MISIEAVSFVYRYKDVSLTALEDIDLEIEEGESVAIMGANGSGKTTLAWCINGLLLPSSGEVTVDGLSTYRSEHIPAIRRRVGMVFQNPDNQIVATTVEREIAFGLENIGIPPARMRQRVTQALRRFELEQYRHHPPHRLSGGEKQRLAIASVLAMEPKYLILDEPTSLLDPRGRREVNRMLKQIQAAGKVTVIHITQSPEEALEADRLIVLSQGRIVLEGSPRTVFQHCDQIRALGLDIPLQMQLERVNNTKELDQYLGQLFNHEELGPSFSHGRAARSVKISTHNLSHIYNNGLPTHKEALSGVNIDIKEGEFLALVGPIGSGKTTLAQHFNGLLKPTSGQIKIEGQDLWKKGINLQKVRQKVGLIFQFPEFQLFEEKVGEDVAFGPRNLGIAEEEVEQRVRRALEAVELDFDSFSQRSPMHLSQGEKRRVAIAGVLAMDPEVIVLDEPTVGLDLRGTKQMVRILRDLHRQGKTIVLISHNMDLVAQVSKRITVLSEGKVVLSGSLKDVFSYSDIIVSIGLELPQIIGIAKGLRMKKQSSAQLHWSSLVAN